MALLDRLMDLDSRFGVPRDADEAFDQSTRFWWVGLAISTAMLVLVLVTLMFGSSAVVGAAIFVPLLAFASGYYYAQRLAYLGKRSPWLDQRSETSTD